MRFVGVPAPLMREILTETVGWKMLGYRIRDLTKAMCPVGESDDGGGGGTHLRDTIEVRFITGTDPRILVGSVSRGDVFGYLVHGTDDHWVEPRNAKALSWTQGGVRFFSKGHMVSGIQPNDFPIRAMRQAVNSYTVAALAT